MEGDALLLVAAACVQDGAALGGGLAAHFGEEAGLAESGGRGDGEQRAVRPVRGLPAALRESGQLVQHRVHDGEFTVPLEQLPPAPASAPHHGAPPPAARSRTTVSRHLSVRRGAPAGA